MPPHEHRWRTLAVLCLSLLVITVDGTIVNIALPSFVRELSADTTQLQWIVDAYTLVFAGLLLAAGSIGDRFGRHHALRAGMLIFAAGSALAAICQTPGQLIATRVIMGAGAALVMPATLSILTDVFRDSAERTKAIALWTAVSGLGVAIGPTAGGWLLEHFAWSSIFLVNLPLIAIALIAARRLVPASAAPDAPRLDVAGALLSVVALTTLTWTVIEAPNHGWLSTSTLIGALATATAITVFAWWQRRVEHPLVDLSLFRDARYAAASGALAVIFFSLFGSLFVLTQILQFMLGYGPLQAGLAALPFAIVIGATSPVGAHIAQRIGAKVPVAGGLLLLSAGLGVMSTAEPSSRYGLFLVASVLMAAGMGMAMAPATESIMDAVPADKAGVGSAMNDATREIGGVLGVAVIGSVVASAYTSALSDAAALSPHTAAAAGDSIGAASAIAAHLSAPEGQAVITAAREAFIHAADRGVLIAAAAALLGAAVVAHTLPGRQRPQAHPAHLAHPARAIR
ncbi:MAG TPA: MFS transporter [Solirubrobacteraceae bacterium]|nr:MFS transporter [Solirubrobacteraceae bacterium]